MKTSPQDYHTFEGAVLDEIEAWGLTEWDVRFDHEPREGQDAWCGYEYEQKQVCFGLTDDISDSEYSEKFLKKLAFHEVCELLISELITLARMRTISSEDLTRAAHCVIMRLQNRIFHDRKTETSSGRILTLAERLAADTRAGKEKS